jgi:universal stress protein A
MIEAGSTGSARSAEGHHTGFADAGRSDAAVVGERDVDRLRACVGAALAPAHFAPRRLCAGCSSAGGPNAGAVREHTSVMNLPRNILVPVDLGEQTESVLDYAVALAAKLDAKIHLLHVFGRPLFGEGTGIVVTETVSDEIITRCQNELDRLVRAHAGRVPFGQTSLRFGDPRTEIQTAAVRVDAELIVMGTHGRRGVSRLVLGSVAESIARTALCPVLLVRAGVGSAS